MASHSYRSVHDALAQLSRLVTESQGTDPLSPISILVPSHAAGLDVTRYLGRTLNSGAGSVSIRAFTLKDLATELVSTDSTVHGRTPLSPVVRQGAVSKVLAERAGIFEHVAEQPATARAIARTAVLLDSAMPSSATELPPLMQEVLRVHKTAGAALNTRWYADHEAFMLANQNLQNQAVRRRLGTTIGFMLGTELRPDAAAFRQGLEAAGMRHIDAAGSLEDAVTVIRASDADDEVRAVVRLIIEQLDAGTPGHRIGVFHSAARPYSALLTQRLTQAGVTFTGPTSHRLSDSPFARGLLQLLTLDPDEPDKRTILNILAEGTLVWRDHELPSSATCERLHTNPPPEDTDGEDEDDSGYRVGQREKLALFHAFVAALGSHVQRVLDAASWLEVSAALTTLIEEFMGPRTATELPEKAEERAALLQIVGDLGQLEGIGPAPRLQLISSAVEDGIAAKGGWAGKSGTGVVIGGYADAVARDLDSVFLLGAAEGLAPTRIRENPLLPDSVHELLDVELLSVEQRAQASKEKFFAALASGAQRTITSPRGDLRGSGNYQLSRWITTEATELTSFAHGIENGAPTQAALPPTAQEWRLRHLLTRGIPALPDDAVLQRAVAVTRDRRHGVFSRFNGNLGAHADRIIDSEKALSPTALEEWVRSPFTYFLKRILRISIFEDVELEVEISPLQRGNLVHQVLEDYVNGILEGQAPSSDPLLELAEAAFADVANPSWLSHVWERNQAMIRQDLQKVFDADQAAAADGWKYVAAEAPFGFAEGDPVVELMLDDGSGVRFGGKVDRIDRHDDGSIRVIDYKTGKADSYRDLKSHPTANGTRFQLPVYGLFARTLADTKTAEISAQYWFISKAGGFASIGYPVSEEVIEQLRADAGLIIDAVRKGVFPPRPESARYTARNTARVTFTSLMGQLALDQHWPLLKNAPKLAPYAELLEAQK
ncbi:PD-(D/E)XK nuclease family protein [Arthrobacter monumenti]